MLKNALNDNGVPAWTDGSEGATAFGGMLSAAGLVGIAVNIRQIDLKPAKVILDQFNEQEEDFVPAWICTCGEEVDEGFAVCWSCGNEYSANN